MSLLIRPKLLWHINERRWYAFRGVNQIAYRFGRRIKVARIEGCWGPFYRVSRTFMESMDFYLMPKDVPAEFPRPGKEKP